MEPEPSCTFSDALTPTPVSRNASRRGSLLVTVSADTQNVLTNKKARLQLLARLAKETHFSPQELSRLLASFMHATSTGIMQIAEFKDFLAFLDITDEDLVRLLYNAIDQHGKGYVDFESYARVFSAFTRGSPEEKLTILFNAFDHNHDGSLSYTEISQVMRSLIAGDNSEEEVRFVESLFHTMDMDGDGTVTLEEFMTAVSTNRRVRRIFMHLKGGSFRVPDLDKSPEGEEVDTWLFPSPAREGSVDVHLPRVDMSFTDLCYEIPAADPQSDPLPVLKRVSGNIKSGEFLLVLGVAGSGSSSLLGCLSGRILMTSGQVLLNGQAMPPKLWRRYTGYMTSSDLLCSRYTVRQCLLFTASLQLHTLPLSARLAKVESVLQDLNLDSVAHVDVSKLSPSDHALALIGQEMVTSTRVLFLDNPTAHLDSKAALDVMEVVASVASRYEKTVVCAIAQPPSLVVKLFHSVMALCAGHVVFHGPVRRLVDTLESVGHPVPAFVNPAEHYLRVIASMSVVETIELKDKLDDALLTGNVYPDEETSRVLKTTGSEDLSALMARTMTLGMSTGTDGAPISIYPASMTLETKLLLRRGVVRLFYGRAWLDLLSLALLALLLGTLFLDLPLHADMVISRLGLLFFATTFVAILLLNQIPRMDRDVRLFHQERRNGVHRTYSFLIVELLLEILRCAIGSFVFAVVLYPMASLAPGTGRFFFFVAVIFALMFAFLNMLAFVVTACDKPSTAYAVAFFVLLMSVLLAGFFNLNQSFPVYWRWLQVLSFHKYAFHALYVNDMTGLTFSCGPNCFIDWRVVLRQQGMDQENTVWSLFMLLVLAIAWRLLRGLVLGGYIERIRSQLGVALARVTCLQRLSVYCQAQRYSRATTAVYTELANIQARARSVTGIRNRSAYSQLGDTDV